MAKQDLYERLRQAGYSDDEAVAIVANSPRAKPEQGKPAGDKQGEPAQASALPPWAQALITVIIQLLTEWRQQPNQTPGKHDATEKAIATLTQLRDNPEGKPDGEDESA